VNGRGILPIGRRTSITTSLFYGNSSSGVLPPHYLFMLGGMNVPAVIPHLRLSRTSLYGIQYQELQGVQAHIAGLGLRYEPLQDVFLTAEVSTGNAFEDTALRFRGRSYLGGAGLTAGYLTPLGPIELTVMTGPTHKVFSYANIGFDF
jgi:outer membrane translocation and assembly module TamA